MRCKRGETSLASSTQHARDCSSAAIIRCAVPATQSLPHVQSFGGSGEGGGFRGSSDLSGHFGYPQLGFVLTAVRGNRRSGGG